MTIDLTPYAEAIDNAIAERMFAVVATNGADVIPDLGFKGSLQVVDQDHLSFWERSHGQTLANLRAGAGVSVLYFSAERGMYLRLYGRATLYEDGPMRDEIMARTPQPELDRDPERTGIGVLIRVDRLVELFSGVSQEREIVEAA